MNPAKMPPPSKVAAFAAIRERDRKALALSEETGASFPEAYAKVLDAESVHAWADEGDRVRSGVERLRNLPAGPISGAGFHVPFKVEEKR